VRLQQKHAKTCYAELVFLLPVQTMGHVVHSIASRDRNGDTLFSISGGPDAVSIKSVMVLVTPNLSFCIQWDLRVT
jgi:hypothetical protein